MIWRNTRSRAVFWGALLLLLSAGLAPAVSLSQGRDSARLAMDTFAGAIHRRDKAAFLSGFSRTHTFRTHWLIINEPIALTKGQAMSYAFLEEQCAEEDDGYCGLFLSQDGIFRQTMLATGAGPWREVSERYFVPPDQPDDAHIFVRWREENGRFVIDDIGIQLN